jgi:hypothetical protein
MSPYGSRVVQRRQGAEHCCAPLRDLLDAPTALAACCGFDLCHKYILYLYLYLYLEKCCEHRAVVRVRTCPDFCHFVCVIRNAVRTSKQ